MDISFNTTEPGQIQDWAKPLASLIGWKKNTGEKGPAYSNSKQQIFHRRFFLILFHQTSPQKYCIHTINDSLLITVFTQTSLYVCYIRHLISGVMYGCFTYLYMFVTSHQTPHLIYWVYVWLPYLSLYICYCQTPHLRYSMAVLPIFMCLLSSYTIHSYTSSDRHIVSYFLHKSAIIWSSSREKT